MLILTTVVEMGIGAILEPSIVVSLLFGGAWVNRATDTGRYSRQSSMASSDSGDDGFEATVPNVRGRSKTGSSSPSLLPSQEEPWRFRKLSFFSYSWALQTPNTAVFKHRFLSRVLQKFPFLVEAWYWALIYWVSLSPF